jgi:hypothetical protein
MTEWRRLSEREALTDPEESLYDGVPPWLGESLWAWVHSELMDVDYRTGNSHVSEEKLREIERRCRVALKWAQHGVIGARSSLKDLMSRDPRAFLDVVDLLLFKSDPREATELEQHLSEAGSLWRVVDRDGRRSLERRVTSAVAEASESAMRESGRSGQLLARAWAEQYGRDPNASAAFRDAVRAVESAAQPIVLPSDPKATLGKIIPAMRDAPSKWRVVLQPTDADPVASVVAMMELLWKSQHDRHGDADETRPLSVSDSEAEAAVHLAAALVHLFASGAVTRA